MRAVITLGGASRLKCVCARGVANSLERSEANAASPPDNRFKTSDLIRTDAARGKYYPVMGTCLERVT